MVCMIADYRENGVDMHNEYIALNTDNVERAVYVLSDTLRKRCCGILHNSVPRRKKHGRSAPFFG